jgi:hypothetical protein
MPFAGWLGGLMCELQLHPMDQPVETKPTMVGEKPQADLNHAVCWFFVSVSWFL